MQIARYRINNGSVVHGIVDGDTFRRLPGTPFEGLTPGTAVDARDDVTLLAPVDRPRVFGLGLNYVSHITETNSPTPTRQMLFMKPDTAVVGPDDPVIYPREGQNIHFEAELAIVIGRGGRRFDRNQARQAIFGCTCANDISERSIQSEEMAQGCLLIGKGFDTFCPLGPVIATGLDLDDLLLEARINGETRQSIRTSDLLFSTVDIVQYLSEAITLQPGDIIITGTPSGVGSIKPGDQMEIILEGVGVLSNPVVAESR
ncbi:MAG: fumarylacetoacetate hydrolase family protein [Anderseniella sp.]